MPTDEPVGDALVIAGESMLPGVTHFLKGDVREGVRYGLLGIAARAFWGPAGLALVVASSYTKATTGERLVNHLGVGRALQTRPEAPKTSEG